MTRLSRVLLVWACILLPAGGAMAQPAEQPAAPPAAAKTSNDSVTDMKADIAAARQQQRTTAATRQQIQAIRAALRARLAAMHR